MFPRFYEKSKLRRRRMVGVIPAMYFSYWKIITRACDDANFVYDLSNFVQINGQAYGLSTWLLNRSFPTTVMMLKNQN